MIHELREYTMPIENWPDYIDAFQHVAHPIRGDNFGAFIGSWCSPATASIRFYHLWQFDSLNDRAEKRAALAKIPEWTNTFLPLAWKNVNSQLVSILNPVEVLASEVMSSTGLYLYKIQTKLGKAGSLTKLLAEDSNFRLATIGLWTCEFPDPNAVIVLSKSHTLMDRLSEHEAGSIVRDYQVNQLKPVNQPTL